MKESKFNKLFMEAMKENLYNSKDLVNVQQKPVELKAEQITEPIIHSLEGAVEGHPGEWLLTGVKGEQWPVRDEIFKKKYESGTKLGYWKKKPITMQAYKAEVATPWTTWNGDKMIAEPGDLMIIQPDGSLSSVKPDIF